MQKLYEQNILDHYQNPRNYGLLPLFNFISPRYNPSCGDSVTLCGNISEHVIFQISFQGKGCVISLAMASMLTEYSKGKNIEDILQWDESIVSELLETSLGIKRMQCGLLSLQALQNGIELYKKSILNVA